VAQTQRLFSRHLRAERQIRSYQQTLQHKVSCLCFLFPSLASLPALPWFWRCCIRFVDAPVSAS
jgi:hypothetical protein